MTLVSRSQHRITPVGHVTLPVTHKDRVINVKFYIIDNKRKPTLSGKVCQDPQFDQASAQVEWKCTGASRSASRAGKCIRNDAGNIFNQNRSHREAFSIWPTQKARSPIAQDQGQVQRNEE